MCVHLFYLIYPNKIKQKIIIKQNVPLAYIFLSANSYLIKKKQCVSTSIEYQNKSVWCHRNIFCPVDNGLIMHQRNVLTFSRSVLGFFWKYILSCAKVIFSFIYKYMLHKIIFSSNTLQNVSLSAGRLCYYAKHKYNAL
jgi:hypothetical protein